MGVVFVVLIWHTLTRYTKILYKGIMSIASFDDDITQRFFEAGKIKKGTPWASIKSVVIRKLDMVHYAAKLSDLRSPPGNRLKELSGPLKGYHSIRVNDQFRIVFQWTDAGPAKVRVCDYH